MNYLIVEGEEERTLKLRHEGEHYVAQWNNEEFFVTVHDIAQDRWRLECDGRSCIVDIHKKEAMSFEARVARKSIAFSMLDAQAQAIRAAGGDVEGGEESGLVLAPMPGKVVTLLVAVGDTVSSGQGVIVIEAMKMENELRATGGGVVQEIKVVAGDTVENGAVLLVID